MQVVTQLSFSFRYVSLCVLDHDCPSFVSSRDADLLSVDYPSKLFQCLVFFRGQVIMLKIWHTAIVCSALRDVAICIKSFVSACWWHETSRFIELRSGCYFLVCTVISVRRVVPLLQSDSPTSLESWRVLIERGVGQNFGPKVNKHPCASVAGMLDRLMTSLFLFCFTFSSEIVSHRVTANSSFKMPSFVFDSWGWHACLLLL